MRYLPLAFIRSSELERAIRAASADPQRRVIVRHLRRAGADPPGPGRANGTLPRIAGAGSMYNRPIRLLRGGCRRVRRWRCGAPGAGPGTLRGFCAAEHDNERPGRSPATIGSLPRRQGMAFLSLFLRSGVSRQFC